MNTFYDPFAAIHMTRFVICSLGKSVSYGFFGAERYGCLFAKLSEVDQSGMKPV
jgi:hypothetical protein